jgi:hypothetical protein
MTTVGYNFYCGSGGIDAIDWSRAVGFAATSEHLVRLEISLAANRRHCLAARAVDGEGMEEATVWAFCIFQIDSAGRIISPSLSPVRDFSAHPTGDGRVLLGFSCISRDGMPIAGQFEVLTDHGSGALEESSPLAVVPRSASGRYSLAVAPTVLPASFAVRPREGDVLGPLSNLLALSADAPRPAAVMS